MSSNSVRGGGFRRVYMWNKFDLRTQWWLGRRLLCIKMIHTRMLYMYMLYVYVYINEIWTGGGQRNARQYTMPALRVKVDWTPRAVARCHQFTQYANILPMTLYIFIVLKRDSYPVASRQPLMLHRMYATIIRQRKTKTISPDDVLL